MIVLAVLPLVVTFLKACTGAVLPQYPPLPPFIALEEHFTIPEIAVQNTATPPWIVQKLLDLDGLRLEEMDQGRITKQFLSIGAATVNLSQSQDANNVLAAAINKHPSRFGGWATIPISDPAAAADELTRSVKKLGFVGALINNHDQGKFYDNATYWPFFARAQELNVPIYLHPANPAREWASRFQGNYPQSTASSLGLSGWDWHQEVGFHILRLFNSGFFDEFPRIKIIIGHMGEMLTFQLDRVIDVGETKRGWPSRQRDLRSVWNSNIWITTSGMFSLAPFACLLRQMPVDRILYSVDWPYSNNTQGLEFMEKVRRSGLVTEEQFQGIAYKNAQSVLQVQV